MHKQHTRWKTTYKVDTKDKSVDSNAKGKNTERNLSTLSPI